MSLSRGAILYLALFAAAAAVFSLFPAIDLWSSGWFYRSGFYLAHESVLRAIYRLVYYVTDAISIALPLILIVALWRKRKIFGLDWRAAFYLVVALAVGPGLVVNTVLKDHWGRARPNQVQEFGGTKQFTPALEPSAQCDRNCSFPAGHPSIGFYFVSFAFLFSAARARRTVVAGAILAGAVIGLVRMAQGGHFLSDVVFSGLIMFGVSWVLHDLIVVRGARSNPARESP
jgi:lipid A 4'-phosphatase